MQAFKQLDKTTEEMFVILNKYKEHTCYFKLLDMAMCHYTGTLSHPKFVGQRSYFKELLKAHNPPFYAGYFESNKKRKNESKD